MKEEGVKISGSTIVEEGMSYLPSVLYIKKRGKEKNMRGRGGQRKGRKGRGKERYEGRKQRRREGRRGRE